MKHFRSIALVFTLGLGLSAAAWAQMGMMRTPQIPGEFKPVVGSGAQYQMSTKGGKLEMAVAVVGKESVDGADGYWMETRMLSGRGAGAISKMLMVISGDQPGVKRMIIQMPPRPPMEMPMAMMGMARNTPKPEGGPKVERETVGPETITVPAGTFDCQHYRTKTEYGTTDIWATAKVAPYGTVKMTSADTTMELEKVLTNQTSQITGEPQKLGFPGMPQ